MMRYEQTAWELYAMLTRKKSEPQDDVVMKVQRIQEALQAAYYEGVAEEREENDW